MLADLYGSQRLLATGAIPHQLVFSDPAYLRPCQHLKPAGGYIQFFAADLARGPDGRWRVIDTHTETPAGIGYALANRMVHTNVAGDLFGACRAQRLAPFFQQMQTALARRANRPDPSIALLTPGPRHNDFFSHAYLARYLGLLLVEGGDLRVVGDRVSLKTLEGLMPIDLIVRCIAGAVADPLELDSSGFAGPVGLLQAVREQSDLVVNSLGSALAENRGLGSYLPRLANELLREDLVIADGPRSWLGEPTARRHALANLDRMVIRPAHESTARPGRAVPGRDPARMGPTERAALLQDIELRGPLFVAEEKIGFGTTPSLTPAGLVPKPYAVRLFVTATANGFVGHARRPCHDRRRKLGGGAERHRRRVARRLGDQRRQPAAARQPVAAVHRDGAGAARRPRPAEPRRRQPVLARPLHRAGRLDHARPAHLPQPSAGGQRAAPGAGGEPRRARDAAGAGRGRDPRPRRAHRCRDDRAAGAQPDDLVGLVLRPAAHARQHPSRRQPDARPAVAGSLAHAQRLLRRPALAGQRHAAHRSAIHSSCSTTACECWRPSTASRTRT